MNNEKKNKLNLAQRISSKNYLVARNISNDVPNYRNYYTQYGILYERPRHNSTETYSN